MDEATIQRIEALTAHGAVGAIIDHPTDVPAMVLPPGCTVESVEKLFDTPTRMRRTFNTERIPDFCRYVDANATNDSAGAVFVKPDGSGAKAVIDYGDHENPEWGDHKAVLALVHTAEFAAIEGICGRPLKQREVTDWLEDWREIITPVIEGDEEDDEQEVRMGRAVSAIRKIDLKASLDQGHEDGDFKSKKTSMEQVEASSGGARIPGLFRVHCRVYPETAPRDIGLRLSVLTGHGEPRLQFRIIGREALLQAIAEEVELDLTSRLTNHRVFVGNV